MDQIEFRVKPEGSWRPWYLRCLPPSMQPESFVRVAVDELHLDAMVRVFWSVRDEHIKYMLLQDPAPKLHTKLNGAVLGCPVPTPVARELSRLLVQAASGRFFNLHLNAPSTDGAASTKDGNAQQASSADDGVALQEAIEKEIIEALKRYEDEGSDEDGDLTEEDDEDMSTTAPGIGVPRPDVSSPDVAVQGTEPTPPGISNDDAMLGTIDQRARRPNWITAIQGAVLGRLDELFSCGDERKRGGWREPAKWDEACACSWRKKRAPLLQDTATKEPLPEDEGAACGGR